MPTRPLLLVFAMLGEPTSISNEEIGRLYGEGQESFEQKDYAAAADRFEELFDRIPESPNNRAIRESLALNILDACILGFEGSRDPAFLERGRAFIRRYHAEFAAVYGENVAVIAELRLTETRISELEEEATVGPCLEPWSPGLLPAFSRSSPSAVVAEAVTRDWLPPCCCRWAFVAAGTSSNVSRIGCLPT